MEEHWLNERNNCNHHLVVDRDIQCCVGKQNQSGSGLNELGTDQRTSHHRSLRRASAEHTHGAVAKVVSGKTDMADSSEKSAAIWLGVAAFWLTIIALFIVTDLVGTTRAGAEGEAYNVIR